jgi:HNH endonuclease
MAERTCSIIGCGKRHYAKGWCQKHYKAAHDHGDPLYVPVARTPVERFHEKYNVEASGCWLWFANARSGYGEFTVGKKVYRAHRWSYETFRAAIPEGMVIDHLCRTPLCVNPGHLEPVTRGANVLRGVGVVAEHARQTHCKHGHEFTLENTILRNARKHRVCRACALRRSRGYEARKRLQRKEAA